MKYNEAIEAYKSYLMQPIAADNLSASELSKYTQALVQLMNLYQSKGEPQECISALKEVYTASAILQKELLRDYYSVMGYALSRTENMKEAEQMMLKAFTVQLHKPTPERYFRDYAYAAAVFYSNPSYQNEVTYWCEEALRQSQLSENKSGQQWVMSMLGALYKRNGELDKALELLQRSKEEALLRNDDLGILNSLHSLIDLLLYWDIPEYANIFASEAIAVENKMRVKNPMISAQTYINKGRALYNLGKTDSILFYTEKARQLCQSLPYNSGMVDVNLLNGIYFTNKGGSSLESGIQELNFVTEQGTVANRAKAFHQLAQTYLKEGNNNIANVMLDSLYKLATKFGTQPYIQINYHSIIEHYLKLNKLDKLEQYYKLMSQEIETFKEKRFNYKLVESVVELQKSKIDQDMELVELKQANMRLWFSMCTAILVFIISVTFIQLINIKKKNTKQMTDANKQIDSLIHKLNQSDTEKQLNIHEIKEFLGTKVKRQEFETCTPYILKENGEIKFRQSFDLLYPQFLYSLRKKVPSVTRREELLSMLIVLKQDNKEIAELLAIAPRSVMMMRHRYRQKIGLSSDYSLENFIMDVLKS